MGPMANYTDAYERGGHCLPGRSAVEPKGGVPDIFITDSGIHRRGMQSVRSGVWVIGREKSESAPACVATAKMNREVSKLLGFKVFV